MHIYIYHIHTIYMCRLHRLIFHYVIYIMCKLHTYIVHVCTYYITMPTKTPWCRKSLHSLGENITFPKFLFLGKSDKDKVLKILLGFRDVNTLHIFLGAVSMFTHFLAWCGESMSLLWLKWEGKGFKDWAFWKLSSKAEHTEKEIILLLQWSYKNKTCCGHK